MCHEKNFEAARLRWCRHFFAPFVEKSFFYADRWTGWRQCRNADENRGLDVGMDKFRSFWGLDNQKIE